MPWGGKKKPALSWVTTSADTVSRVTKMANFLVVPASRSECANTRAPGEQCQQYVPCRRNLQLMLQNLPGRYVSVKRSYSSTRVSNPKRVQSPSPLARCPSAAVTRAHHWMMWPTLRPKQESIERESALTLAYTSSFSPGTAIVVCRGSNRRRGKSRARGRATGISAS